MRAKRLALSLCLVRALTTRLAVKPARVFFVAVLLGMPLKTVIFE